MKKATIFILLAACMFQGLGQSPINSGKDSTRIHAFDEVIPAGSKSQKGLFAIYQVDDKWYLEIPFSLMEKELLIVTRISRGGAESRFTPADSKLFAGDEISNAVIKFERASSKKILLRKVLYSTYGGDSTSAMYQSVVRSSVFPILEAFPIEAFSKDGKGVVINVDRFILGDNELFSFSGFQKRMLSISAQIPDRSYINYVSSYPGNLEINTVKTYSKSVSVRNPSGGPSGQSDIATGNSTLELNTSIILLPENPMRQRFSNEKVGYFSLNLMDYDANPQGIKIREYIKRWRLEPKKGELGKYLKGELVEPQKPIVFYIDPATPKKWIPYLIEGVNDWNTAFEQAGFKNAIVAKEAPTKDEDSTWSLFDARHSAIVYKPSEIENASGPSIADPRTGEILESHINWYHNVMQLIHDWYFVQCSMVDTNARKFEFDEPLMGQLIRFVSSHEVGHALGLLHNMGASTKVPVDSLRNNKWVEANGICPSIMDYARFNYVAQPEDNISQKGLMPRIGVYDKWAIEWGYRILPDFKTPMEEKQYLNNWAVERAKDTRLQFINEHSWDPRNQKEDLGNDAVAASSYGIKNLRRLVPQLLQWTKASDEGYAYLHNMYSAVQGQFQTYLFNVIRNIGGDTYENLKTTDESGPVYTPVPYQMQKEVSRFLNKNIFETPAWLVDTAILNRTGQTAISLVGEIQMAVIRSLLAPPMLAEMHSRSEGNFPGKTYTVLELLDDLKKNIWTELYTHKTPDVYRKNLQKNYLLALLETLSLSKVRLIEIRPMPYAGQTVTYPPTALLYGHIEDLLKDLKTNLPYFKDKATVAHYKYLYYRLEKTISEDIKNSY